jgi:hypothetical protein
MSVDNTESLLRRTYAADTRRASYYWSIERNGLIILSEYDTGDALHRLNEIPPPPFVLHARAYRETDMPHFTIPIEAGQSLIWEHSVRESLDMVAAGQTSSTLMERTIFGRRFPDGREQVKLIYPDGSSFDFSSIPGEFHTSIAYITSAGHSFEGTLPKDHTARMAAHAHVRL